MRNLLASALFVLAPAVTYAQDTTVVRSTGAGVWRNPRLVEDLRIGGLDGDDRYIFGRVSALAVTSDGSIWVGDAQGPRVRIYDRNGRYVRDVGRPGAGPGEIRGIGGIRITPDRRVAIWDLPNQRVSLYRENGQYISAFSAVSGWWGGLHVDSAGRFWVYTTLRHPSCVRGVTADGRQIGSEGPGCLLPSYQRFSAGGVLTDTVVIPVPRVRERVPSFVILLPEGSVQPFIPEWVYALSPRGDVVTAHTSRYAINIVSERSSGGRRLQHVTRIERAHQPIRLTAAERSEWQARADHYTRINPRRAASWGVRVPAVKPPLRGVSVDADGRIWVDRYVAAVQRPDIQPGRASRDVPPALTWREPRTFDVFEPSGRFLGTVVVPRGTRLLLHRGNTAWGVARGPLDEHHVVRYRLETD